MNKANISLFGSAVLVWLREEPDMRHLDTTKVQPPPAPNPELWWVLHEAITYAVTLQEKHNKLPWIKTGDQILRPKEITELYITMGDPGGFGSNA